MRENIEISNLQQLFIKGFIQYQNQTIIQQFFFSENLLEKEMKKTQMLLNKLVYLDLSILELIKIVIYVFWFGHVKPKNGEKEKLHCMDKDSFIAYIKQKVSL